LFFVSFMRTSIPAEQRNHPLLFTCAHLANPAGPIGLKWVSVLPRPIFLKKKPLQDRDGHSRVVARGGAARQRRRGREEEAPPVAGGRAQASQEHHAGHTVADEEGCGIDAASPGTLPC